MSSRYYELYRETTVGMCLQNTLDELVASHQISTDLAERVLLQFDKSINTILSTHLKNRITIKAPLRTYQCCDEVYTFLLEDVVMTSEGEKITSDCLKVVTCKKLKQ
ncbi:transcription initiation factor IIA subunit 2-like [Zophobas morio]|uniref:transcription initiation factor IIA subunit 2-like n=1 Tax=Zophobas morio TaxID=2755281 RepID=UPI003082A191